MRKVKFKCWLFLGLLILFWCTSQIDPFVDEFDVLLGGKEMLSGKGLYQDYFSHHLPLPYYVSAGLHWITSNSFPLIRLVWATILFFVFWLNLNFVQQCWGKSTAGFYFLSQVTLLFLPYDYYFSLQSDSVAAHFVLTAAIRIIYLLSKKENNLSATDYVITISSLLVVAHSALSLLPLTLLLSVYLGFKIWHSKKSILIEMLIVIGVVEVLNLLILLPVWTDFFDQTFNFNRFYYSQFNSDFSFPFSKYLNERLVRFNGTVQDFIKHWYKPNHWLFLLRIGLVGLLLSHLWKLNRVLFWGFTLILAFVCLRRGFYTNFEDNRGFHQLTFLNLFAFFCSILWYYRFKLSRHKTVKYILIIYLGITFSMAGFYGIRYFRALYIYEGRGTSMEKPQPNPLLKFGFTPDDQVWVVPFGLKDMYKWNFSNDMKYAYYLPWHAVCEPCRQELKSRLMDENAPKFILWNPNENVHGHIAKNYATALLNIISSEYQMISLTDNYQIWRKE